MNNKTNNKQHQQEVAKRLQKFLNETGYKQKHIAEILNISKQIMSEIIKGNRKLYLSELNILKNACNLNPNWLITGEGDMYYDFNTETKKEKLREQFATFEHYNIDKKLIVMLVLKKILDKIFVASPINDNMFKKYLIAFLLHIDSHESQLSQEQPLSSKKYFLELLEKFDYMQDTNKRLKEQLTNCFNTQLDEYDCEQLWKYKKEAVELLT